jgi:hypothetical protein
MVIDGKWKRGGIPLKWDGKSAERIVSAPVWPDEIPENT